MNSWIFAIRALSVAAGAQSVMLAVVRAAIFNHVTQQGVGSVETFAVSMRDASCQITLIMLTLVMKHL